MKSVVQKLRGTGVAMVTPFNSDSSVDYPALQLLVENLISGGCNFLVVLGTTGEPPCLSTEEKSEITRFVVQVNNSRLPLVLGISDNCTSKLIDQIKKADLNGYDALLIATPYYNKPSQSGLVAHYTAIADMSPLPIILYNVPGRTGINMTVETTNTLAQHPNIIGLKDASGNIAQLNYLLLHKDPNFLILSGDDCLSMPQLAMGIDGVISVAANAFPKVYSEMIAKGLANQVVDSRELHFRLIEVMDLLFVEGNPTGVKAAMASRGVLQNNLRLPLVKSTDALYSKIEKLIKQHNLS